MLPLKPWYDAVASVCDVRWISAEAIPSLCVPVFKDRDQSPLGYLVDSALRTESLDLRASLTATS